jgi:hypothetical protein
MGAERLRGALRALFLRKEVSMDTTRFDKPVRILVGLGYPATINSALQAYQFLSEYPVIAGGHTRAIALKACKAAIKDEIDPETARSAFIAFAERNALLGPETPLQTNQPPHRSKKYTGRPPAEMDP